MHNGHTGLKFIRKVSMALFLLTFFQDCKNADLQEETLIEVASKPLFDYAAITNEELRQIAIAIEHNKTPGFGKKLVAENGQPLWDKAVRKVKTTTQWFIPFSKDLQSVFAVAVFEKVGKRYKFEVISPGKRNADLVRGRSKDADHKAVVLAFFNQYVYKASLFGNFTVSTTSNVKLQALPQKKDNSNHISARWEVYETCITTNLNCNCPPDYTQCDLCSQCLRTDCWETWVWSDDEDWVDPTDPGGGGSKGGGGSGPNPYYNPFYINGVQYTTTNYPGINNGFLWKWWENGVFLQPYGGISFGTWAINYLFLNPNVSFSVFQNQFFHTS